MPSQHNIPIVLLAGVTYFPGLLALLMSLEINSGLSSDQEIIILQGELFTNEEKEIIRGFEFKFTFLDVRELGSVNDSKLSFFDITGIQPFPISYCWFRKTFDKFFLFKMEGWKKIIFIDADMLCMDNITEMLDFKPLAVTPEFGEKPPEPVEDFGGNFSFCTGFMVLEPNEDDYRGMIKLLAERGPEIFKKYPTGDQAIINHYFYKHYPDKINMLEQKWGITNRMGISAPELMGERPKLLHYLGNKPWNIPKKPEHRLEKLWWHYFILAGKKLGGQVFAEQVAKPIPS